MLCGGLRLGFGSNFIEEAGMEVGRRFPARGWPVLGKQTRGCGVVRSGGDLVEEWAAETRGVGD